MFLSLARKGGRGVCVGCVWFRGRAGWDGPAFSFIWWQELVVERMLRRFLTQDRICVEDVAFQNCASSGANVKNGNETEHARVLKWLNRR